jgi:hypothetical protein
MYQSRLNIESAELVAFSENFIEQYATDNNKCFRVALKLVRRIGTTITGSMKIFRKFCPVVRKKLEGTDNIVPVLDYTKLTTRKYSDQFFGAEVYMDLVQTLLHELVTFFYHLVTVLKVCKDMIRKEEEVRGDFAKLKKIWDNSCEEVVKGVIEISAAFGSVQLVSEDELQQRRKNARPMKEWLGAEYHNHDKNWIRKEAYIQRIISGRVDGLDDTASQLWAHDHPWGLKVCRTIRQLDDLGLTFKNTKTKGKKGKFDSIDLVFFIKWSRVSWIDENGKKVNEDNEKKFYLYLCRQYKGEYELPTWQAVCRQRAYCEKEFTLDDMKASFEKHLPKTDGSQKAFVDNSLILPISQPLAI